MQIKDLINIIKNVLPTDYPTDESFLHRLAQILTLLQKENPDTRISVDIKSVRMLLVCMQEWDKDYAKLLGRYILYKPSDNEISVIDRLEQELGLSQEYLAQGKLDYQKMTTIYNGWNNNTHRLLKHLTDLFKKKQSDQKAKLAIEIYELVFAHSHVAKLTLDIIEIYGHFYKKIPRSRHSSRHKNDHEFDDTLNYLKFLYNQLPSNNAPKLLELSDLDLLVYLKELKTFPTHLSTLVKLTLKRTYTNFNVEFKDFEKWFTPIKKTILDFQNATILTQFLERNVQAIEKQNSDITQFVNIFFSDKDFVPDSLAHDSEDDLPLHKLYILKKYPEIDLSYKLQVKYKNLSHVYNLLYLYNHFKYAPNQLVYKTILTSDFDDSSCNEMKSYLKHRSKILEILKISDENCDIPYDPKTNWETFITQLDQKYIISLEDKISLINDKEKYISIDFLIDEAKKGEKKFTESLKTFKDAIITNEKNREVFWTLTLHQIENTSINEALDNCISLLSSKYISELPRHIYSCLITNCLKADVEKLAHFTYLHSLRFKDSLYTDLTSDHIKCRYREAKCYETLATFYEQLSKHPISEKEGESARHFLKYLLKVNKEYSPQDKFLSDDIIQQYQKLCNNQLLKLTYRDVIYDEVCLLRNKINVLQKEKKQLTSKYDSNQPQSDFFKEFKEPPSPQSKYKHTRSNSYSL